MIAEISFQTQYGKQGQAGISRRVEHDGEKSFVFAHSVQDAVEYVKSLPLFSNAQVETDDYSAWAIISSEWLGRDTTIDVLFSGEPLPPYIRQQAVIRTRNTIYESAGYRRVEING